MTATTTGTTPVPTTNQRVYIFDTTLRDGEQSAGASMTVAEKLEVADALSRLGVDIIEAGFPIASPGDLDAVRQIATRIKGATVCGLARALKPDIDAAIEALRPAEDPRIHTFVSTSPIHLAHQIRKSEDQVIEMAEAAVRYAKSFTSNVEFSAMDASRSDLDYLARVCTVAIKAGATTINLPDTLGYAAPTEYAAMFQYMLAHVDGAEKVIWSTHCHDDLGLATANTLAAVAAGARQMEVTVNGIGERAGNTSLEEVVMALRTRRDQFGGAGYPRALGIPRRRLAGRQPREQHRRAAKQGDCRAECLRARLRHPSGRPTEASGKLRDHDAAIGGLGAERDRALEA